MDNLSSNSKDYSLNRIGVLYEYLILLCVQNINQIPQPMMIVREFRVVSYNSYENRRCLSHRFSKFEVV